MYKITLNWIRFKGMDVFRAFLWICSGESATVFFSQNAAIVDSEILSYLVQVLETIDCEDW